VNIHLHSTKNITDKILVTVQKGRQSNQRILIYVDDILIWQNKEERPENKTNKWYKNLENKAGKITDLYFLIFRFLN